MRMEANMNEPHPLVFAACGENEQDALGEQKVHPGR